MPKYMTTPTLKLYPKANNDLEQTLGKKCTM